jgi:hypothetical protein
LQELLANIHNIFSKPWERYNAHLHFDDHACHDRLSPSEWDAGGYFDPEFVVNGRMVLYAHFEHMDPVPNSKMDASGYDETRQEDKLWYWGTYGDMGIRTKVRLFDVQTQSLTDVTTEKVYRRC